MIAKLNDDKPPYRNSLQVAGEFIRTEFLIICATLHIYDYSGTWLWRRMFYTAIIGGSAIAWLVAMLLK